MTFVLLSTMEHALLH